MYSAISLYINEDQAVKISRELNHGVSRNNFVVLGRKTPETSQQMLYPVMVRSIITASETEPGSLSYNFHHWQGAAHSE